MSDGDEFQRDYEQRIKGCVIVLDRRKKKASLLRDQKDMREFGIPGAKALRQELAWHFEALMEMNGTVHWEWERRDKVRMQLGRGTSWRDIKTFELQVYFLKTGTNRIELLMDWMCSFNKVAEYKISSLRNQKNGIAIVTRRNRLRWQRNMSLVQALLRLEDLMKY